MKLKVPLSELLPDKFFQENTPYKSLKDFLSAGGFHPETHEDIEAIPQPAIDAHVAATTKFKDWHELMQTAMQQLHFFNRRVNLAQIEMYGGSQVQQVHVFTPLPKLNSGLAPHSPS